MNADLLITNIGQLVTCASPGVKRGSQMLDIGIVTNAAVAVKDGRIVWVGPQHEVVDGLGAQMTIHAHGKVVCPGFVDPHTHIVFGGDRLNEFELKIKGADYLEILGGGGGILSTVARTRDASFDELLATGLRRLDRMRAGGTTTCEIKTGYGLDGETEIRMLQVIERLDREHPITIVPTFLAAHAIPSEFKDRPGEYVDLVCSEMLPLAWEWYNWSHFHSEGTPFFCDVFCERGAFDLEQSRRILETAKSLGFQLKAHVDEFTNLGGSWMAVEKEAVSIDHLDAISRGEIDLLAASGTVAVITPAVNFNFGSSTFADARALVDAGCAVALSTDFNPGSAPCPSQALVMAIACRYQKLLPAEAMNACTINAAHAIGLGAFTGSIEVGKSADLVVFDADDYRELAYEFGSTPISQVIKGGKIVFDRSQTADHISSPQ